MLELGAVATGRLLEGVYLSGLNMEAEDSELCWHGGIPKRKYLDQVHRSTSKSRSIFQSSSLLTTFVVDSLGFHQFRVMGMHVWQSSQEWT